MPEEATDGWELEFEGDSTKLPGIFDKIENLGETVKEEKMKTGAELKFVTGGDIREFASEQEINHEFINAMIPNEELLRFKRETGMMWSEGVEAMFEGRMERREFNNSYIQNFVDRIRGVKVLHSHETEVWLPFAELHCPKVNECEVEFRDKKTNQKSFEVKLSIMGIGGGYGRQIRTTVTTATSVKSQCVQLQTKVKLLVEECEMERGGFYRAMISDFLGGIKVEKVEDKTDKCNWTLSQVKALNLNSEPFILQSNTTVTKSYEQEKYSGSEFSIGISMGSSSNTIGLTINSELTKAITMTYTLNGGSNGFDYLRFSEDNRMGSYWLTTQV